MSTPLEIARALLEDEISSLGRPSPDTAAWFTLRAKSLGLSSLRKMEQLGLGTLSDRGQAADQFVRAARKKAKIVTPKDVAAEA